MVKMSRTISMKFRRLMVNSRLVSIRLKVWILINSRNSSLKFLRKSNSRLMQLINSKMKFQMSRIQVRDRKWIWSQ